MSTDTLRPVSLALFAVAVRQRHDRQRQQHAAYQAGRLLDRIAHDMAMLDAMQRGVQQGQDQGQGDDSYDGWLSAADQFHQED